MTNSKTVSAAGVRGVSPTPVRRIEIPVNSNTWTSLAEIVGGEVEGDGFCAVLGGVTGAPVSFTFDPGDDVSTLEGDGVGRPERDTFGVILGASVPLSSDSGESAVEGAAVNDVLAFSSVSRKVEFGVIVGEFVSVPFIVSVGADVSVSLSVPLTAVGDGVG